MKRLILNDVSPNFIKYSNEQESITLTAHPDEIIEKKLITYFDREDRAKIRKASDLYCIDNTRFILWFGMILAFYIVIITSCTALNLAGRNFQLLGTYQSLGVFTFPITFVMLDSLSATMGYRYAKNVVFIGVASLCFIAVMLVITMNLLNVGEYKTLLERSVHLLIMQSIGLLAGDQTNNLVFRHFKSKLIHSPLWARCLVSTVCGSAIQTCIWVISTETGGEVLEKLIDNYGRKIVFSILLIPITYLLAGIYKRYVLQHKKNGLDAEKIS